MASRAMRPNTGGGASRRPRRSPLDVAPFTRISRGGCAAAPRHPPPLRRAGIVPLQRLRLCVLARRFHARMAQRGGRGGIDLFCARRAVVRRHHQQRHATSSKRHQRAPQRKGCCGRAGATARRIVPSWYSFRRGSKRYALSRMAPCRTDRHARRMRTSVNSFPAAGRTAPHPPETPCPLKRNAPSRAAPPWSTTSSRHAGQDRDRTPPSSVNQRDLALACSPAWRRPARRSSPTRPTPSLHLARQPRRGHHQRHRRAGPGRHRPAGRQTGDGRQGRAVQEVRRHRRFDIEVNEKNPRQARRHHRRARNPPSAASTSRTSRRPTVSASSASCASA